jgi:hypothetical protein
VRSQTNRNLTVPPSRHSLPLRWSCLTLVPSLMLLAGLAGCGPASPDNASNIGSRASIDDPPLSKQSPSPGSSPFTSVTQAASSLPIASGSETGGSSRKGTVSVVDSPRPMPVPSSEPGHLVEGLVVPESMAEKLNSPSVLVRLRALEAWAQSAPPGSVDPFILAFEDRDERVRARAQKLIEQDWARKAEAEKSGERGER